MDWAENLKQGDELGHIRAVLSDNRIPKWTLKTQVDRDSVVGIATRYGLDDPGAGEIFRSHL